MIPNGLHLALATLSIGLLVHSKPVPQALAPRQQCEVQSCTIAALSGSSGQPYDPATAPQGGSDVGDCCILTYNPSAAPVLFQEKPELQALCGNTVGSNQRRDTFSAERVRNVVERQGCAAYTLIYARGTGEIGTLGETVGPALQTGLTTLAPGKWSIQGVDYDATVDGDDCLGLPGGQIAAQQLEQVAAACPDTKFVVSGYSEGAMVAHNGVAYASSNAASRVNGVVVFGDPFNGAPIKNYNGPIQTYCAVGDGVCSGEFNITPAHLSYVGVDTSEAVAYIQTLVSG